jgi:arsenate reductase
MAEALLRFLDPVNFEAFSAGSHPAGYVHPLVYAVAEAWGIPVENQVSKGWSEFADRPVDLVITVCDSAAQEPCPVWPGAPLQTHWPLPDPSFHLGDDDECLTFARAVFERLRAKLERLIKMDLAGTDRDTLQARLDALADL